MAAPIGSLGTSAPSATIPTAPATIPPELTAAFAVPLVITVTKRLATATEGAAPKSPAKALGLSTSLRPENAITRVPPNNAFNATAISC